MTKTQRNIVIVVIVVLIVGIPLAIWAVTSFNGQTTSGNTTVIVDRDTGEVFDEKVNNEKTGGSGVKTGDAVLFGIEPFVEQLYEQDESTGYVNAVKTALWNFSDSRLNNQFESITLRPQDLIITDSGVSGTIRLGQTDTILPILIVPTKDSKQAIITINKGGSQYKGAFIYVSGINNSENLLFSIKQKDDHTSDLEVRAFSGYREAALKYVESIGYRVPDFVINISNYENPFK